MLEMFHQEGELFIFVLVGGVESGKFSIDGVNGGTVEGVVGDASDAQRCLVVLIVEEFLGEELLEFEPSPRCFRWEVGFPVITSLIHMW